jgi:hypothetical protein
MKLNTALLPVVLLAATVAAAQNQPLFWASRPSQSPTTFGPAWHSPARARFWCDAPSSWSWNTTTRWPRTAPLSMGLPARCASAPSHPLVRQGAGIARDSDRDQFLRDVQSVGTGRLSGSFSRADDGDASLNGDNFSMVKGGIPPVKCANRARITLAAIPTDRHPGNQSRTLLFLTHVQGSCSARWSRPAVKMAGPNIARRPTCRTLS